VARRGFDAARRYFRAFRDVRSADDAFRLAFGTSTAEFESAALATLATRCTVTHDMMRPRAAVIARSS
jgi:hypothetical protein